MYFTLARAWSRRLGMIRKGIIYRKCLNIFALLSGKYLSSYPADETVTLNSRRKSEDIGAEDKVKAVWPRQHFSFNYLCTQVPLVSCSFPIHSEAMSRGLPYILMLSHRSYSLRYYWTNHALLWIRTLSDQCDIFHFRHVWIVCVGWFPDTCIHMFRLPSF